MMLKESSRSIYRKRTSDGGYLRFEESESRSRRLPSMSLEKKIWQTKLQGKMEQDLSILSMSSTAIATKILFIMPCDFGCQVEPLSCSQLDFATIIHMKSGIVISGHPFSEIYQFT
ncbi:hypothetical protein V6N12_057445 [Hibiscus sabdariffa]|uniref:Uncharacterized protein n=1 Tax=Hibiscus sabdariffa TaxID=183260 RepID=A0ABR2C6J8_9ROSI